MIGRTNCTQKSGSSSEFVNVQMLTNQAEHSNLNGAVLTMSYETYSKQYTWDGSEITFSVPAHVSCTIEFPEVEGYKKPDNITFVAVEGNSRTIEAEYKAELVKVNVTSSNGSAVSGAKITINGKQQTWNGTEIRQLVPFGTQYSVVAGAVSGFGTPSTQTFTAQNPEREVSVVYIASSLKVNILSNQGTDTAIANVKATVKYGSTSVQVANGGTVNLPTNVSVTISFPEVADYKKPADITYTHTGGLVEKSGAYKCELLTVNVSADQGSVSGFEVTISKQEAVGVATKYTRLEYIENTGSAYIDTGFIPNQDTRVVMDFQSTQTAGGWPIFGSRQTSANRTYTFGSTSSNNCWLVGYNTSSANSNKLEDNQRHTVDKNKNICYLDGVQLTSHTYANFTSPGSMRLCNFYSGDGDNSAFAKIKIYSCRIYDNGTIIRDYIPALRSDGIAGLYDAVNDTFYASKGSGNFVAGAFEPTILATQTSVTGTYKIPFDTSYTVKANNVNGYTTPESVNRVAVAKSHTVAQLYKVITVRDLSLCDVYGNPINRSTANCYVVREVGQYKFPLVYGNAIKNGKVNTAAFTNNGGTYSHDFKTILGSTNIITQPYIDNDARVSGVSILNADVEGCVTNISFTEEENCRYVQFDVTSIPTSGANVIIGVSTVDVAWSWHIWLWPHDLLPVEITNSTGVKYNIMPVNLASKYDSDGVHIKNWFYQWGRKDPMLLPSTWNSTSDHTPGSIAKESKASVLTQGIMSPTTFYYNSPTGSMGIQTIWFNSTKYYNLWDAACTSLGSSDNDTVKTVYDPCPVGWKVPNGNVFTGMSEISYNDGIYKLTRYSGDTTGVTIHVNTCRNYYDGNINTGGECHLLTSAVIYSSGAYQANSLRLNGGYIYSSNGTYMASGNSIRPVQDDLTKLDTI